MLKKRLIFTLLYKDGVFNLSRNFRLQTVGDLLWLKKNYNFSLLSGSIDELVVLDVSRGEKNLPSFCDTIKKLSEGSFVPVSAGGGVRSIDSARKLLRSGADKIVINSMLYTRCGFVQELAQEFGQQCVVASIDVKLLQGVGYQAWADCGRVCQPGSASEWIKLISEFSVGEIYLNSIDRDGTGQGFDFQILNLLPRRISQPVIFAGGVGNVSHLAAGLADPRVDAVATANLFNFVGDGLANARKNLLSSGADLPKWLISQT